MIRLGDLSVYGFGSQQGAFSDVKIVEAADLAEITGPALIIADGVVSDAAAAHFLLDDELAGCGRPVLLPTISVVTGGVVDRGLTIVPEGQRASVGDVLILPTQAGVFHNNKTPELAFQTAYSIWSAVALDKVAESKRLALDLSVGADANNGEWWLAGALCGLLRMASKPEFDALMADPTDLFPSLQTYSAKARQLIGGQIRILDRQQSEVAKSMLTQLAPMDYWARFISDCTDLGLAHTASRYQAAAQRIWG